MTRRVQVGKIAIGGGAPVSVQTMTNTDTRDVAATLAQIDQMAQAGADIVRVSVYDAACAEAVRALVDGSPVPLVADIHFDYRLAVRSIENGIAKVRINPGNIGGEKNVRILADCLKQHHVPVRIGVNSGSIEKDLLKNHVGVEKEVEEAEVNYELKKKDYENAVAALKVYQIDPGTMVLGQPLVVRSPIAGEVVKDNIVLGQYIKEDAGPLALVADLSKVWVVAHVKEKDIRLIQRLSEVEVRLTAMPDVPVKGTVYHISELLDPETRSVEVLIECDNRDHRMKPYMYGTVQLTDAVTEAMLVPTSAILQQEESCYVLVCEGANRFRKAEVTTASTDGDRTVVLSGVRPGEEIVTGGAFYLLDAR